MHSSRKAPLPRPGRTSLRLLALLASAALWPAQAQASMFKGETLDKVADVMSWAVLIIAPTVGLAAFWIVHILPEKIAEKRQHPQAAAIQTLCLLSLVFGGLLWPIAWLWAFSKPVLHKMAYGTDKVAHGHDDAEHKPAAAPAKADDAEQLKRLKAEIAALEAKLATKSNTQGGKA